MGKTQNMFEFDDLLECLEPSYELFGVVAYEKINKGPFAYVSYVRKMTKFPIETGEKIEKDRWYKIVGEKKPFMVKQKRALSCHRNAEVLFYRRISHDKYFEEISDSEGDFPQHAKKTNLIPVKETKVAEKRVKYHPQTFVDEVAENSEEEDEKYYNEINEHY